MMEKIIITPKTRLHDLLEAWPQLEDTLIQMSPQFKKLRNPVLRNTIARATNLNQAAAIGGLEVEHLVVTLRREIGQTNPAIEEQATISYQTEHPGWFREDFITQVIDAREMLSRGDHPVHEVMAAIRALGTHEILQVEFPFLPAPLLDKSISSGFRHMVRNKDGGECTIYFTK